MMWLIKSLEFELMNYIFLSYINRSGSTFLVNQFSKLDIFCVCPEAEILYNIFLQKPNQKSHSNKSLLKYLLKDKKFIHWKLLPSSIENILNSANSNGVIFLQILDLFRKTHFPSSKYIIFKYNFIIELKSYFESIRLDHSYYWISLHRNPLTVYASQKNTTSPNTQMIMAVNVVHFCSQVIKLESLLKKVKIEENLRIKYEALILDFTMEYKNIFNHLGIKTISPGFISNPGKIKQFMSKEYRDLHPYINLPPDNKRIYPLTITPSKHEEYYILKKLGMFYPDDLQKIPRFKLMYLLPLFKNMVETIFIYAKTSAINTLNRHSIAI
jgi:hypothetical protein